MANSGDGFNIFHSDIDCGVSVESVVQAYRDTYNRNFGTHTSRISNNYLLQLNHEGDTLPDYNTDRFNSTYRWIRGNKKNSLNSNRLVASGDKVKSAHTCKNAEGRGYSCAFPQGSFDYGTCC
ncbi:CQS_1a_G0006370.mRNA.1.CDS.1 [Saccharomyces cerevisiae]|nr:CQS_1a_G0006370.mRNA.1.CDS.1 [Saccharomyces cerevisiae]CAI7172797.1 CQS_1a_G0006370.mRNA.1.CDS.1 [Saccharomyces cerevisiae]